MDVEHSDRKVTRIILKKREETQSTNAQNGNGSSFPKPHHDKLAKRLCYDLMPVPASTSTSISDRPHMMPLLSIPNVQEDRSKASIIMSGTANKGGLGPSIGAVDIGSSKCAYYFRISLPGVKRDPGQFSCEIEHDGKVHVRGETITGGKTVSRQSRVFEIKFQQHTPPGPFTLSFSLPGPVDPRLFYPLFRSDGIFEAVVMKSE